MTITHVPHYADYASMLEHLRETLQAAAGVEGADTLGALFPLSMEGRSRRYGEFSSLGEWLDDVADTLEGFLSDYGDEVEGWTV
jgi:hypothetical protein